MYEKRIERLIAAMQARGADAVLVASKENRYFFSGFTGDTGAILITEKSRTLFVEQRYALQATMETRDYAIVNTNGGLYNSINDTIIGDGVKRIIFEDDYFTVSAYRSLRKNLRYEELLPAGDLMLRLRAVKDQAEISVLTEAAKITDDGIFYARNLLKVGALEKEIAFKTEMYLRGQGADALAFKPVVVSGARTAMPSAIPGVKELAFGDIVVVNLGIIYKGYCTDCSRTYFIGSADERGRNMYEAVSAAAQQVVSAAKTGIPCRDVEISGKDALAAEGFKEAYRHCAGNGLGLSESELPRINLRSGDTLCTNMTLSLGAGAYIEEFGGMRISDTVVVTPEGGVKLTNSSSELAVL